MSVTNIYIKSPLVNKDNVDREFVEVEKAFTTISEVIALSETFHEPKKVVNFMIRFADGVSWNPEGKGRGLYMYMDGAWNKFNLS